MVFLHGPESKQLLQGRRRVAHVREVCIIKSLKLAWAPRTVTHLKQKVHFWPSDLCRFSHHPSNPFIIIIINYYFVTWSKQSFHTLPILPSIPFHVTHFHDFSPQMTLMPLSHLILISLILTRSSALPIHLKIMLPYQNF